MEFYAIKQVLRTAHAFTLVSQFRPVPQFRSMGDYCVRVKRMTLDWNDDSTVGVDVSTIEIS